MNKNKEFFVVWQGGADEQFWNQYDSLEDAVSNEGGKCVEVFSCTPKALGLYDSDVKIVLKKSKTKKEKVS